MSKFEDIILAYKTASVNFVNTNEDLLTKILAGVYDAQDDDFLVHLGFSKIELLEHGVDGLVRLQKHPPLGQFYEIFAEGMYHAIFVKEWNDSAANFLSQTFFGWRPDFERIELEREIETNRDLPDENLVGYLLTLRGPFGTRALKSCTNAGTLPFARVTPSLYTVVLLYLCNKTSELLRSVEGSKHPNTQRQKDETDFFDPDEQTDL